MIKRLIVCSLLIFSASSLKAQGTQLIILDDIYLQAGLRKPTHLQHSLPKYVIHPGEEYRIYADFVRDQRLENPCSGRDAIKCIFSVKVIGRDSNGHEINQEQGILQFTMENRVSIVNQGIAHQNLRGDARIVISVLKNRVAVYEFTIPIRIA